MEKIPQSHSEHLKPVKIYLDDVEKIVEILGEVSSEVSISTKEYLLKDLEELKGFKKEQITHMELKIREPYVSLTMEPSKIWLYIAEDEPTSRGLFEKIKQIFSARERKITRILHNSGLWGIILGLFFPLLLIWNSEIQFSDHFCCCCCVCYGSRFGLVWS